MRITEDLLIAALRLHANQGSGPIGKATHLRLNSKKIDRIENLEKCTSLQVLYLYENHIVRIENLHVVAASLTHLYLQHNRLREIENLSPLRRLTKLYLDGNMIVHLCGLEQLQELQELHICNQILESGQEFIINEETMQALSGCLITISLSGNKIVDASPLRFLSSLEKLDISSNSIQDIEMMKRVLKGCRMLRDIDLSGNPIAHQPRYAQIMIASAPNLESLDGRDVSAQQRQSVHNLEAKKHSSRARDHGDSSHSSLGSVPQRTDFGVSGSIPHLS